MSRQRLSPTRSHRPAAPCITCSFQAEDVVLVDMMRQLRPDIPVLFLETFHHFAETLAYRDELAARWQPQPVNLKAAEPRVGPLADEHDRLLRAAQGRPALLARSRATTPGSRACGASSRPAARTWSWSRSSGCRPARCWRRSARWRRGRPAMCGATRGARHPAAAAVRRRLLQHRLRALHDRPARSAQPAFGPVGRPEARVRDSYPAG